jgi:hypothetical protein
MRSPRAARQAGRLGEDIVKTIRLALFPLQFTAAAQDRFQRFIHKAVDRVPSDKRIAPPPQIIGPVLEGVRYEQEATAVDEMFSELLSSSMHTDKIKDAHPAIPFVIKQLSSDEAEILNSMATSDKLFNYVKRFYLREGLATSVTETNEIPTERLIFPENLGMYTERLERLGLIRLDGLKPMEVVRENGRQTGGINFFVFKFTSFGISMMRACGKPPVASH